MFIKEGRLWACGCTDSCEIQCIEPRQVGSNYQSVMRLQTIVGDVLIWKTDGSAEQFFTKMKWTGMTVMFKHTPCTLCHGICNGSLILNVWKSPIDRKLPKAFAHPKALKATFHGSNILVSFDQKGLYVLVSFIDNGTTKTAVREFVHEEDLLEWQKYDLGVPNTLLQDAVKCCKSRTRPSLTSIIFRELGSETSLIVDNNRLYGHWSPTLEKNVCYFINVFDQKIVYATISVQPDDCLVVVLEGGWLWFRGANTFNRFGLVPDRCHNVWRMAAYRVFIPIMKISSRAAARFTDVSFVFE